MNLTCYIIDNEPHSLEILKSYIEKTPGLELRGSQTNPLDALNEVISSDPPDFVFLEVDMVELSGMDFAVQVAVFTKIIFTPSFPDYAVEAFEKEAFDYLLKPISYERFLKAVNKFRKYQIEKAAVQTGLEEYFFIKTETKGKVARIVTMDIFYIEAAQNYIKLKTRFGNHMAYLTMDEITEHLPSGNFICVHRSFIVNRKAIKSVEHGQVTLTDNSIIPLGRSYKEPLLAAVTELLVQSKRLGSPELPESFARLIK